MTHETGRSGRSPLSYGILNFAKRCQKDADLALSAVLAYFPGQISQPRFIQSILFQGRFWTSFVCSFQWLHLIRDVTLKFFQQFLLQSIAFV